MKQCREFVVSALVGGLLVVVPIYLAVLLLLTAMQSFMGLVRPFAMLLPEWFPAENVLSLLLVLMVCFLIGVAVRTPTGRAARERIETALFERLSGYALFRSLTQRLAGESQENVWQPALAESDGIKQLRLDIQGSNRFRAAASATKRAASSGNRRRASCSSRTTSFTRCTYAS
jgi:uncharacterized membrane protein